MTFDADTLYKLLPATYRVRDDAQGGPLRALVEIIAQEALALEENLAQLYDDLFIETCADWVAPYIGDLIGYRPLGDIPGVASPRAEIVNTIGYRRRKGTAAMLEQLASDVAGTPARVIEFFQLLATTQYMNHVRRDHRSVANIRPAAELRYLGTPFDPLARTADVRRIAAGRGRYNIPNLGIFLWRLRAYPATFIPAFRVDERRFCFSPLGNSMPLFNTPQSEATITQLAGPLNVPMPISRRVLHARTADYYGADVSIAVYRDGTLVPIETIAACDLSDSGGAWAYQPAAQVAIDPELGRIAFPTNDEPPGDVRVSFYYGFSADISGGEYERAAGFDEAIKPVQTISAPTTLQSAIDGLNGTGAIEIGDSTSYQETLAINLGAATQVEIRAANERRPLIVLNGEWTIDGGAEAELTLDGVLIAGAALRVTGNLRKLTLRHCTLVPGLTLDSDGAPASPDAPSLFVESASVVVEIEACILGGVRASENAIITIRNSLLDATGEGRVAYAGLDGQSAGAPLRIENSTVIGRVHTRILDRMSNTIVVAGGAAEGAWTEPLRAERRQEGCVRFSYIPLGSRTPRRYQCQPASAADAARVRPQWTSTRYGDPGYGQLSRRSASEIREGADDGGELGVFHDLFLPQREANLRVRLDEYLRFGLEAGIFYAT